MIHRYVFHNDRLQPIEQSRLSPGQAGLLNGFGLFSTLRVFSGEAFAFERHWRRLEKDAERVHLPMPYAAEFVRRHLAEVIRANEVREGTARIYLVYNTVGFWRSNEPLPEVDLILYTAGLPPYREPVRLALRPNGRFAASPICSVKTTAWLNNVWHVAEAQKAGFDEVVLLNERGEVAECTAANVFAVTGGRVLTPPLASGCLEGVTRGVLLEIAPRIGIPMEEHTLTPDDLRRADEMFISSTNRNLLGVGSLEDQIFEGAPGPVTRRLEEAFAAYVADYVAQQSVPSATK
ncbi:MAG TPA: aminotransferase class IV [Candidatus Acidoferrales bacterium]|nr:aminotransferase class IV [Candidatus Acidoferrales bacterium]